MHFFKKNLLKRSTLLSKMLVKVQSFDKAKANTLA